MSEPRGWWIAFAMLAVSLVATPTAAQEEDCGFVDESYSDTQRMRRCVEEHGIWSTLLHSAAQQTNNPAVIQVLLETGGGPQRHQ